MSKIYAVGIGPGNAEDMTYRAEKAIQHAGVIVGYCTYIKLIKGYFPIRLLLNRVWPKKWNTASWCEGYK